MKDNRFKVKTIGDILSTDYGEEIEKVDEVTNEIMDMVRETLDLDSNTDIDDVLYSKIHDFIKGIIKQIK